MKWRLFATLREAAGNRIITIDLDSETTISGAVKALVREHPELRDHILDEEGDIPSHLTLMQNGTQVTPDELDNRVNDDDELVLYPPVTGG